MSNTNDTLPDVLGMTFVRLQRLHRQEKSPIEGMRSGEIKTLLRIRELSDENGVRVSEVSNSLRITPPSLTQVLTGLEKNGLIGRQVEIGRAHV